MRRVQYQSGSLRTISRKNGPDVWEYRFRKDGKQKSVIVGDIHKYKTRSQARRAVDVMDLGVNLDSPYAPILFRAVINRYLAEELPERKSTRTFYRPWIDNYIQPKWGDLPISEVKPMAVETWLKSLNLSPKSLNHIRSLMRIMFHCAMRWEMYETQRNPMDLVRVKNASKQVKQRRALNEKEFQAVLDNLDEPFKTMATIAGCLGLRVSEIMGLQWGDFNWKNATVRVQRAVVIGAVDKVKTVYSEADMPLSPELAEMLKRYKLEFCKDAELGDWVFPSPIRPELPWSQTHIQSKRIEPAGILAGVGPKLGWHDFRHTYSTMLRHLGVDIKVQMALLRHTDIRTTMRYTHNVTADLREANDLLVGRMMKPAEA